MNKFARIFFYFKIILYLFFSSAKTMNLGLGKFTRSIFDEPFIKNYILKKQSDDDKFNIILNKYVIALKTKWNALSKISNLEEEFSTNFKKLLEDLQNEISKTIESRYEQQDSEKYIKEKPEFQKLKSILPNQTYSQLKLLFYLVKLINKSTNFYHNIAHKKYLFSAVSGVKFTYYLAEIIAEISKNRESIVKSGYLQLMWSNLYDQEIDNLFKRLLEFTDSEIESWMSFIKEGTIPNQEDIVGYIIDKKKEQIMQSYLERISSTENNSLRSYYTAALFLNFVNRGTTGFMVKERIRIFKIIRFYLYAREYKKAQLALWQSQTEINQIGASFYKIFNKSLDYANSEIIKNAKRTLIEPEVSQVYLDLFSGQNLEYLNLLENAIDIFNDNFAILQSEENIISSGNIIFQSIIKALQALVQFKARQFEVDSLLEKKMYQDLWLESFMKNSHNQVIKI